MKNKINGNNIKDFFRQNSTILFFIVLLAYILRILPYLLGYSIPFTEDSIRDFQQVKFILDNKQLDLLGSYQDYGAFPILHLLVVGVSFLGLDPLKVFLFFPQILPSLSLIFFYLFLKKYFPIKHSLLACFLITVFIPHIHWSAQPVRETIGLFLFPIIIFLFDKFVTEKFNQKNFLLLILSLIILIPTHHWSAIMTITWLTGFSFFLAPSIKKFYQSLLLIIIFTISNLIYWYYLFPISFTLIKNLIIHINFIQLITIAILIFIIIMLKNTDLNKLKNKDNRRNSLLIIFILLWLVTNNILPLNYPLQIWFSFIIFLILIFIGLFYTKNQQLNNLLAITIFYLFFILMALTFNDFKNVNINSFPFDPFRTFEFAIFPLSIIAAFGLLKLSNRLWYLKFIILPLLILSATFAYPPIFIYGQTFINTPFYDIRSNIRYISDGEKDLVKWANDHGYNVASNRPEIRSYQATFYPIYQARKKLVTNSDKILEANYDHIRDPILMVEPYNQNQAIDEGEIIYKNNDGYLISLRYDSKFLYHNIPTILDSGSHQTFSIKMINTSDKAWHKEDNYLMTTDNKVFNFQLVEDQVNPNAIGTFTEQFDIPTRPRKYEFRLRIYREGLGFFGEYTSIIYTAIEP